ncbi:hypothetical protein T492DRAFT_1049813, partial [Pavlovales sp. CCMP2436]
MKVHAGLCAASRLLRTLASKSIHFNVISNVASEACAVCGCLHSAGYKPDIACLVETQINIANPEGNCEKVR